MQESVFWRWNLREIHTALVRSPPFAMRFAVGDMGALCMRPQLTSQSNGISPTAYDTRTTVDASTGVVLQCGTVAKHHNWQIWNTHKRKCTTRFDWLFSKQRRTSSVLKLYRRCYRNVVYSFSIHQHFCHNVENLTKRRRRWNTPIYPVSGQIVRA